MQRLVVFAWLVTAGAAFAGLTGQVSATGQAVALEAGTPNGGTQQTMSAMLQENLGLQYSGLPFGPSVLLLGAGLQASNTNTFSSNGAPLAGRTASLDFSVGLLPRRALPVRLYARGTLSDSGPQTLPTLGGRESLAYGVNLNLEPGGQVPTVRADLEEQRFTGPGTVTPLGDLRRFAHLGLARSFGAHQVSLSGRFDQEARTLTGAWMGGAIHGSWLSPAHQTTLVGTLVDRQLRTSALGAPTATTERQLRLEHVQRFSPQLQADARARLGDARFDTGEGSLGGLGLGLTWRPFDAHELAVSASGDVGFTNTTAGGPGQSAGAAARAGYARALGPVRASAFVGGGTQWCGCNGLTTGFLSSLDAGGSVGTLGFDRIEARVDYRLALVDAPAGRGGKRTEHHLLGFARARVTGTLELTLNAGYDDGFRDYIDVTSGQVAALHEQAFFVGGMATVVFGRLTGSADLRHTRGGALIPGGGFVGGPPPTARALTSGSVFATLPVLPELEVNAGLQGAFTAIDGAAPLSTVGGNVGLNAHLGRISAQLSYQFTRADTQGLLTLQHFLRLTLSRPFEVF